MSAEFNWWLLIVGIVAGAGLAWLVLADSARREREIAEEEVPAEAAWIERTLADGPAPVDAAQAEAVLRAHRTYLGFPPPDALVDPDELRPGPGDEVRPGTAAAEPVASTPALPPAGLDAAPAGADRV